MRKKKKIYCSQCKHSQFVKDKHGRSPVANQFGNCLSCEMKRYWMPVDSKINGCPHFIPEGV